MVRAEESTQHSEIQRDLRAEDSDFLQEEESSVTAEVLKGTHRAGWGRGRKTTIVTKINSKNTFVNISHPDYEKLPPQDQADYSDLWRILK